MTPADDVEQLADDLIAYYGGDVQAARAAVAAVAIKEGDHWVDLPLTPTGAQALGFNRKEIHR